MYSLSMVNFCVVVSCTNNMKKRSHYSCRRERSRGKQGVKGCMASEDTQTRSLRLSSEAAISLRVTVVGKFIDFNFCSFLLTLVNSTFATVTDVHIVLQVQQQHLVLMCSSIQLGWSPCDEEI